MSILDEFVGNWNGTCGFRLMPHDDLSGGASRACSTIEALGHGWSLRYTWVHPDDGEQSGTLLLGSPMEGGAITAGWVDSWHQQPELRLLTGTATGDPGEATVELMMEYEGWGWTLEITPVGEQLRMTMRNVVPEGTEGAAPGAYVVMHAAWERDGRGSGPKEASHG